MQNELTPVQQVKNTLVAMTPQFESILPGHVSVKKFMQTLNVAILNDKNLLSKDRASLFKACLELASMGLSPGGSDAALIAYGPKVDARVMIGGLLRLIRESGEVKSILAELVYKNDSFEYVVSSDGIIFNHKPDYFGVRGERIGAYAYAILKDGTPLVEVLTNNDIAAIKSCSKGSGGPWASFEEQMIKKSCIRRLSKRLPLTQQASAAVESDDQFYEMPKEEPKTVRDIKPSLNDLVSEGEVL
ncbi:MAG: hypothetical protein DRI84_06380 [Bacteroidetes bacterium]|nr:MAG: hypothetical protein DRI84_06380 [Bacteroidota bacterium]